MRVRKLSSTVKSIKKVPKRSGTKMMRQYLIVQNTLSSRRIWFTLSESEMHS